MKIDDIDVFVVVICNVFLSQVVESLGLIQFVIIWWVQSLEEFFGVVLLDCNIKLFKFIVSGLWVYEQCWWVLCEVDGLCELVVGDVILSGVLCLGVLQSIGEVVLLDVFWWLVDEYLELCVQVGIGWGSYLLVCLENVELDVVVVLFLLSKVFFEEFGVMFLGCMEFCVVVVCDSVIQV